MSDHRPLALVACAVLFGVLTSCGGKDARQAAVSPTPLPTAGVALAEDKASDAKPQEQPASSRPLLTNRGIPQPTTDEAPSSKTEAFAAFDQWIASGGRDLAVGQSLAKARRAALQEMIRNDPKAAIARAVPMRFRQNLPPVVTDHLEQRVDGMGTLGVAVALMEDGSSRNTPTASLGDTHFINYTYGNRLGKLTRTPIPVHGIALDGELAMSDSPVRVIEPGEIVPPERISADQSCPVSQKAGSPAFAIDVGSEVKYLCSGGHLIAAAEGYAAADSVADGLIAQSSWTEGPKTLLYIRARFSDQSEASIPSETTCAKTISDMSIFFNTVSYGKQPSITTTVTPIIVLPKTEAEYKAMTSGDMQLMTDARAASKTAGYDTASYQWYGVRYVGGPGSFSGQAWVGSAGVWMKTDSAGVAAHEWGHNLGLWHANSWNPTTLDPIGAGGHQEYGNSYDTMGSANGGNYHFNAGSRNKLDWLPNDHVHTVSASGTYKVYAVDTTALLSTSEKQGLRILPTKNKLFGTTNETVQYWLEHRALWSGNAWMNQGVMLRWSGNASGSDRLIDTTPQSADGKTDAAIVIGRTFSDRQLGIHVTPVTKTAGPPAAIDVVINIGAFSGNQSPTGTLSGPSTVALNTDAVFTVTASDADGDTLAYAWNFGDRTFGANSVTVTKKWSVAGDYVVSCTVSDMKGGTQLKSLVVKVGTPTNFTVSGKVLDGAAGVPGILVWNGQGGNNFRGSYTDAGGNYTVTQLTGSVTLQASAVRHAVTAAFTNPLSVTASLTGINFSAVAFPTVTVATIDGTAGEGAGNTGTYRISRTGSTTAALSLPFTMSGTAAASDFTLSPASPVSIPAGSSSVDIVLTGTTDASPEPKERATLTLTEGSGYELGLANAASVYILDQSGPINDDFANRITLSGTSPTATGSNVYATNEIGEPRHGNGNGTQSSWWSWTAPYSGSTTVSMVGSSFIYSAIGVYTGNSVSGLTEIAGSTFSAAPNRTVNFNAVSGTAYQIAVDGAYSSTSSFYQGSIVLSINGANPPSRDIVMALPTGFVFHAVSPADAVVSAPGSGPTQTITVLQNQTAVIEAIPASRD
ncbi:hypothetical protein LBMAG53_08080 [Planctomycetota bacterium]|nr:hypothetical protein LBMAG53_08080 [Planctomycetota bacterium]